MDQKLQSTSGLALSLHLMFGTNQDRSSFISRIALLSLVSLLLVLSNCSENNGVLEPLQDNWEKAVPFQQIPQGLSSLSAETCGACHQDHYNEWKRSTHAHAWTDKQFQAEIHKKSSPYLCINCHIPLENQQEYLIEGLWDSDIYKPKKKKNPHWDKQLQQEGVTCAACHVRDNKIVGPTGTTKAPHPVKKDPEFLSEGLCISCHNANASLTPTLACTFETGDEWKNSKISSEKNCITCHMTDTTRSIVPGYEPRLSHMHSFPGSGIPKSPDHHPDMFNGLDIALAAVPQSLEKGKALRTKLTLTNAHAGHRVPTGDPERFIEIIQELRSPQGRIVASQHDTIGEKWQWYPTAKKLADNNLNPGESRSYELRTTPKTTGKYELVIRVVKHRLNKKSAHYNKLGEDYPLSVIIYREVIAIRVE